MSSLESPRGIAPFPGNPFPGNGGAVPPNPPRALVPVPREIPPTSRFRTGFYSLVAGIYLALTVGLAVFVIQ
ncbi:MAG: hypothetical protein M1143_04715, partial [Candidatus Thermoplasmatota archaeon]|nr:hypothetical protein [Candidatus Thermoplasmatota archaeon]